jgi:hypothetical protein
MTPRYGPHLLGAVFSSKDDRDYSLDRFAVVAQLPPAYVPPHAWWVLDQGTAPACVGFSGALNQAIRVDLADLVDDDLAIFDGSDLYAYCKVNDGNPNGQGTSIRVAIDVLMRTGALVKNILDSDELKVGDRVKITAYARLNNATDIKTAIVAYGSAWVASDWPNSWFSPKNGVLPAPSGGIAGGHAWTIIGWDDSRLAWLMQNSWGTDWGSGGRAWLPYSALNGVSWEAWRTITAVPTSPEEPMTKPLGTPTGIARIGADSNIKGLVPNTSPQQFVVLPLGYDFVVYGEATIPGYSTDGSPTSKVWRLAYGDKGETYLLQRNATYTPIGGTTYTTVNIAGTVGAPNATVTWKP